MKFKKTVLTILCALLCLSVFGCGAKKADDNQNKATQQTEQKSDDAQNKNADEKDNEDKGQGSDKSSESGDSGQAPVIESGEELKSMVDEFNTTDDPEKKEELRKKLEAFLNQAEQQSSDASENK